MKTITEVVLGIIATCLLVITLMMLAPPFLYFLGVHVAPIFNDWLKYWRIP